ncbi:MAG: YebC/PmpR family DNA-binding transcriptional regulator [Rickettsiales bacterium]|jgi:YebC/PmpR family DNA-binding regulatory protein|nr:YebC/PmpR family DNA-binding transcriptional regulator [Rickettsiales bacterium]
MAGHSKWANIQHRKGKQDKLRGNLFTKIAREITIAAKLGDPNPDYNPRLRLAVLAAKKNSMPNDNIKRAIEKGTAGGEGSALEEIRYEGFAPHSVAVIVECLTDNRNRSATDVRTVFGKNGGAIGAENSVAFNFNRVGIIVFPKSVANDDDMMEMAINAGASDIDSDDEFHTVITATDELHTVGKVLIEKFGDPEKMELTFIPTNTVELDKEKSDSLENFIEKLEDLDDVQKVYTNAEFFIE